MLYDRILCTLPPQWSFLASQLVVQSLVCGRDAVREPIGDRHLIDQTGLLILHSLIQDGGVRIEVLESMFLIQKESNHRYSLPGLSFALGYGSLLNL